MSNLPNFSTKCPIEPGNYTAYNVTAIDNRQGNDVAQELWKAITPVPFPNGLYRHLLQFSTDGDKNGVTFYWHVKIDQPMNENVI